MLVLLIKYVFNVFQPTYYFLCAPRCINPVTQSLGSGYKVNNSVLVPLRRAIIIMALYFRPDTVIAPRFRRVTSAFSSAGWVRSWTQYLMTGSLPMATVGTGQGHSLPIETHVWLWTGMYNRWNTLLRDRGSTQYSRRLLSWSWIILHDQMIRQDVL